MYLFTDLNTSFGEVSLKSHRVKAAKNAHSSALTMAITRRAAIKKDLKDNWDNYDYDERGELMEESKDVQASADRLKTDLDTEERELKDMTRKIFERYGRRVILRVFIDNNERNPNCPINFYDEFGNTIVSTMEVNEKFESLVVSTCRGNQPLEQYIDNPRFTCKYNSDCFVVFAIVRGVNMIVVRYTSGNVFYIENDIGVHRLNFFEHIESADSFLQN